MKENNQTALLAMDFQSAILKALKEKDQYLEGVKKVIDFAHDNHIPVIYSVVGFRKDYPEVSSNNLAFSTIKSGNRNLDAKEASEIDEMVAPSPLDIIVTKKRFSAFTGSDLEVILRSLNVNHIVLAGISTSGVVLSTLREAADKDFRITVLSDCCTDADEEVHRVLTTKVFPRQASVITAAEWITQKPI